MTLQNPVEKQPEQAISIGCKKLYNYFSASTKLWEVFKRQVSGGITVKPLQHTR